jgi:hypothetical protein
MTIITIQINSNQIHGLINDSFSDPETPIIKHLDQHIKCFRSGKMKFLVVPSKEVFKFADTNYISTKFTPVSI